MEYPESQKAAIQWQVATAKGPYAEAVSESGPVCRSKYWLIGDADPVLPARVLGVLNLPTVREACLLPQTAKL